MEEYITIAEEAAAEYVVQKSRFISLAKHIESETEAKETLQGQKRKYYDARHSAYAWVLGEKGDKQKSSDDGEPGGTAGIPILESVKKKGLTNVIVVVTRYFGGIKLGAGGLVRAYGHSAVLALEGAKICAMRLFARKKIIVDYPLLSLVENYIRQKEIPVEDCIYAENVAFVLLLLPKRAEEIQEDLTDLTAAKCKWKDMGEAVLPAPVDFGKEKK